MVIALALLIAVSASLFIQAWAHSVYVYEDNDYLSAYYVKGYTPPLYFVIPPGPPAYCGDAVRYSAPYNASFNALGYAFTLQNGSSYLIEWPVLIVNWSTGGYLGLYMPRGTLFYPSQVSPLPYGYAEGFYYSLPSPVTSTASYLGQVNFSPTSIYPGVWFIYSWNLTVKYPAEDVLSFVDGQSYQTTMVYQGVNDYYTILFNTPYTITNSSDPYDLSGASADNYWSLWYPDAATQPVMLLTPAQQYVAGAVAWSYYYHTAGGNLTIAAVVTFTNSSSLIAHGVVFYLFMKPYGWSVSSKYNESTYFITADELVASGHQPPSPVMGDVIFFGTSAYAIAVEWDPYWAYVYSSYSGATGPWNVWVYEYKTSLTVNPSPSPNLGGPWAGWDGYGSWSPWPWVPNAGDYVLLCVTYDRVTNTLYGFAQDLNDPFLTASFTLSLKTYFTPPGSGTYAFGIGAATNTSYANWALVYANIS